MDLMMTVIAWVMATALIVGAIGGWLVFLISWIDHLYASGRLRLPRKGIKRDKHGEYSPAAAGKAPLVTSDHRQYTQ